jgi:Mg2+-importing ATPase
MLGEKIDALFITVFVFVNAGLGFFQEYKSEQTLRLLKQFTVNRAKVIREQEAVTIKSTEVVPGDIVELSPGDIVPADMRFIDTLELQIDETVLTGESTPVQKISGALPKSTFELYRATNCGFSGTTVVGGKGIGVVYATGKQTVIGEISHLTTETNRVSSFEKGINTFSSFILRLVVVTLCIIFVANLIIKGSDNVIELAIFSIALAVSVIPEALPIVITFSLSKGALRLAQHKVVVKRLTSIEDLGSIEILCTDKTGTLTENKLTIADIFATNAGAVIHYAALASENAKNATQIEPFDRAINEHLTLAQKHQLSLFRKQSEIPFDPNRRRNSVLVKQDETYELIVRGAFESIYPLCQHLSPVQHSAMIKWQQTQGRKGNRVIAIAQRELAARETATAQLEHLEHQLTLVGLIAFDDPIKSTTYEAVAKARKLGVEIKILTGDSREVASTVAEKIQLIDSPNQVITADEFMQQTPTQQLDTVRQFRVFARVSPQQKYEIIQLLQRTHEVGFLGEGINDAPALKIANVGLVVESAADISRESADIILLKRSLHVVIDGIAEGREVFANTTKYIKATMASNFGNFYAVAISSLFITFLPMLPIQILLVNLLSDFPMISIATDSVDPEELKRPKNYQIRNIALIASILGMVSTVFDFIVFGLFFKMSPAILQTNWFIISVLTELVFLYSIRTKFFFLKAKSPSYTIIFLTVMAAAATLIIPYTAIGVRLFKFHPPSLAHLVTLLTLVAIYFVSTEAIKLFYYRFKTSGQ